jgi:hypothetical protein
MELQLFKKTSDDGTILRYSLLISMDYERYGTVLDLAEGGFIGTVDPDLGSFVIELQEIEALANGEVAVAVPHQRSFLRVVNDLPLDGTVTEIVANVLDSAGGVKTGTVVLADADEEEARPITSFVL